MSKFLRLRAKRLSTLRRSCNNADLIGNFVGEPGENFSRQKRRIASFNQGMWALQVTVKVFQVKPTMDLLLNFAPDLLKVQKFNLREV